MSDLTNPLNQDANARGQRRRRKTLADGLVVLVAIAVDLRRRDFAFLPAEQKRGNERKCEIFLCESPRKS